MVISDFEHPKQPVILGFDPGRQKCGLAIMGLDRVLYYHQVVSAEMAIATIQDLRKKFPISIVVIGDQTSANDWRERLTENLTDSPSIVMVDERYTTLEARDRYWDMNPPHGIYRLLPQSLRRIPRPIDDIVAILLIERYLGRLTN